MIDIGKNVAVKLRIGYMVRQVESLFPSVMTAFNRLYPSQLYMLLTDISQTMKSSFLPETLTCSLDITA